jgi:hypothetical protein
LALIVNLRELLLILLTLTLALCQSQREITKFEFCLPIYTEREREREATHSPEEIDFPQLFLSDLGWESGRQAGERDSPLKLLSN